ncbi:Glycosyltransferase Family 34 protein [Glomus cerebriforme]|uniref:Glycosyltransferase Family 34 protein n=1 Tax=Glomus cerebriforme TaxID=658196 RepID=A0A397SSU8_9GLOM|nr:Glycosyltransferase Family 34 protein [Glomus cerebriforme]
MGKKDSKLPVYNPLRNINIYVVIFLISFLILLSYVFNPYEQKIGNEEISNEPNEIFEPGNYNILFAVTSTVGAIHQRRLLREAFFGIKNNLEPCMSQDGKVYYKFLIEPYKSVERGTLRDYTAELIEYDDIKEFPNLRNFQESILQWAQDLDKEDINYNYLVIINDKALINLEKLQQVLEESINGNVLTQTQKRNLFWGSFMTEGADDMAVILGRDAIAPILNSKDNIMVVNSNFTNMITQAFQYYQTNPSETELFLVNDDVGIVEFPNAVENVSIEKTIAVGRIFLEEDMRDLIEHLSIPKTFICNRQNDPNKLNIAIITSSFVYDNLCMLPAARMTGDNKRGYAQRNGYSFVGRSAEFSQQRYKKRKTVWGKFDAVEKVLPHYDWIFWLDMDTVIMNYNVTVEGLFEKFVGIVGGWEQFEKKHLIVARPVHDVMINAGVFMMRNSEWSRDFLRVAQSRRDLYLGHMYEQHAMWDLIRQPEWKPGTLYLDQDDRTFNTFPSRYIRGDFVVHYAPDGCPAKPIIDAIGKMKLLEINPNANISLTHKMDH